ncbi:DUF1826 domain-containing protein [Paracoccus indicus]|uniref:DUF1826 domain-containing protein n=1 Tax=Paracoccus indicus TaxID=2079229 RepID=UPI003AAA5599
MCTYRGIGTQLVQPGQEDAPAQLSTGAAMIMHRARWGKVSLLHRAPPIMGTAEVRSLLAIDPANDHQGD